MDNILLRLRAAGLPVLRLGRADSVHPSLRECLPGGGLWPDTSVAKLRSLARCAGVVRGAAERPPAECVPVSISCSQNMRNVIVSEIACMPDSTKLAKHD